MAQQIPDDWNRHAAHDKMRGKRVAQNMPADSSETRRDRPRCVKWSPGRAPIEWVHLVRCGRAGGRCTAADLGESRSRSTKIPRVTGCSRDGRRRRLDAVGASPTSGTGPPPPRQPTQARKPAGKRRSASRARMPSQAKFVNAVTDAVAPQRQPGARDTSRKRLSSRRATGAKWSQGMNPSARK